MTKYYESKKKWRSENREKHNESNRKWRAKYPERNKASQASWLAANPEYRKQYYQLNKEAISQYQKQWRLRHPEFCALQNQKRRERDEAQRALELAPVLDYMGIAKKDQAGCIRLYNEVLRVRDLLRQQSKDREAGPPSLTDDQVRQYHELEDTSPLNAQVYLNTCTAKLKGKHL